MGVGNALMDEAEQLYPALSHYDQKLCFCLSCRQAIFVPVLRNQKIFSIVM